MKIKRTSLLLGFLFFLLPIQVSAHCPLCTLGAAAAAGGAAYLGVNPLIIGLFIGAFAVSMGWWVSRLIKKEYIRYQKAILIITSFLLTVIPILPIIEVRSLPLYLSWLGPYGTTLAINPVLLTSIFGGLIVSIAPYASKKISALRSGRIIPYQGVILTLTLLTLVGILIQVVA